MFQKVSPFSQITLFSEPRGRSRKQNGTTDVMASERRNLARRKKVKELPSNLRESGMTADLFMEFYFNVDPVLERNSGANHEIGRYTSSHINHNLGFYI
jgi:hypothetical protein